MKQKASPSQILRSLLSFLVLAQFLTQTQCTVSFSGLSLTASLTTVGASSNVTFTANLSESLVSGFLNFTIPSPGSFTPSTTLSKCSTSTTSVTITTCTITANAVRFDFTIASGATVTSVVLKAQNFVNPSSTISISSVSANYYNSTSSLKEIYAGYVFSGFTAAVMTVTPTLTPSQTVIGTTGTVTVAFTTVNALSTTGVLMLVFPSYSSTKSFIASSTPSCVGILSLKSTLTCTFVSSNNTLIITGILAASKTTATAMSFTVDNVRNPYSAVPRTGIAIYTCDQYFNQIDYSTSITFTVTTLATLTNPTMSRSNGVTTVGENSIIVAYFEMGSLPLDANCRLRIDFPSDMPITSTLSTVSGSGMFINATSFQTLSVSSDYLEVNGCSYSEDPALTGTLTLSSVTNKAYVQSTSAFKFTLYSMVGTTYYNIATYTTSLIYSDFTSGSITTFTLSAVNSSNVQASTQFLITMKPAHNIPTSSKIVITFPTAITLTNGTCTLGSTTGSISSSPGSCVQIASTNTLTITNPFASSSYTSGSSFSFVVTKGTSSGTNPISSATLGSFTVNTYAIVSSSPYLIDSGTFSSLYTVLATSLTATIAVDNTIGCTENSTYTFTLTTAKTVPYGGKIYIIFPVEISLTSLALTSCKITISGTTTTLNTTACTVSNLSPLKVTVIPFNSSQSAGSIIITLAGITNPISTSATSTFSISTMDSSSNNIEYVSTGLTVQMTSFSHLTSFVPTLNNTVNGATGSIMIAITVTCPLPTGSIVNFTIPSEIKVSSYTSCTKNSGTGLTSVICNPTTNAISATLTISSTLSYGSVFSFNVTNITNPSSDCSTSAFTGISISESTGTQINAYTGSTLTLQTNTPINGSATLAQGSLITSAVTNYTLTYINVNALAIGTRFQIGYPPIITVPSTLTYCSVVAGNSTLAMTCTPNTTARTISINSSTGISSIIPSGTTIKIAFGPITNPTTEVSNPTSLSIMSFTDGTYKCALEGVSNGLADQFACNYPCSNCSSSNKSSCTSCNTADPYGNFYLYSNNCSSSCPTYGYYADTSMVCQTCSSQCLKCSAATTCTACNSTGTYKYLYANSCVASCPTGYYLPSGTYTCLACNSTCLTCNTSATTCLTCNTTSGASTPNFYNSTCLSSCPTGYLSMSNQCKQCTSPCSTCSVSQTNCSTCISNYSMYLNTCVSTCPNGTVKSNVSAIETCASCGSNCNTCSNISTNTCLSCKTGYLFYNSTCRATCPDGTYSNGSTCLSCNSNCKTCTNSSNTSCTSCNSSSSLSVLLKNECISTCPDLYLNMSGICTQCSSPCLNCSSQTTECTSCISSYYFYKSTCLSSCPSGTGLQSSTSTCVNDAAYCKSVVNSDASLCKKCKFSYNLYNYTCVRKCPTDSYKISSSECGVCDTSCLTCTGQSNADCKTCATTYPLSYGNTCVASCPSGYTSLYGQCLQCISPCVTCSGTQSNCTSCNPGYYSHSGSCISSCPTSTVLVGQTCKTCGSGCLACSALNTSVCTSCPSGQYLYNGTCLNTCPASTFSNSTICQSCDSSCLTCNGTSSSNCLTCNTTSSNAYLQSTSCQATCSAGYVKSGTSCLQCSSPCSSCSGNQTNCSSCITGYSLANGKCSKIQCLTTQYLSASTCLSCSSTCLTCDTSSSNCLSCNHTGTYSILNSNSCISSCASGYAVVNYTCAQCTYPCSTCSLSATNCSTCLTPYVLQSANTCSLCSDGQYYKSSACATCNSNCKTCTGGSSYCLSCDISSSNPYLMSDQCVTSCPTGYTPINYQCIQCQSPCLSCAVQKNYCSTCIPGYFMYMGSCISSCPSGSVYSSTSGSCVLCNSNCDTCSSSSTAVCTECSTGYYLYSSSCYKVCPTGYSPDRSTKTTCVANWYKINIVGTSNTTSQGNQSSSYQTEQDSSYNSSTNMNNTGTNQYGTSNDGQIDVQINQTANQSTLISTQSSNIFSKQDLQLRFQFYIASTILIVLAVVTTLLGQYRDSKSKILSNLIVLLSPLELIVYSFQAYCLFESLKFNSNAERVFYTTIVSITSLILTNILGLVYYLAVLKKDGDFKIYKAKHEKVSKLIVVVSIIFSFKVMKLFSSNLFGMSAFGAQVQNQQRVSRKMNLLVFINMALTLSPIMASDVYGLSKIGAQEGYLFLTFFLSLFFLVISILEMIFGMRSSSSVEVNMDFNAVNKDENDKNLKVEQSILEDTQKIYLRSGTENRLKDQNDPTFLYSSRESIDISQANKEFQPQTNVLNREDSKNTMI